MTSWAADSPTWLIHGVHTVTDGGLVLLAGLLLTAWWRARKGTARTVALALIGPLCVAVSLTASETAKALLRVDRPCSQIASASPLLSCPAAGDWSLPSNHATIAAAAFVAIVATYPRAAAVALPAALGVLASRVLLGVHTLTDVSVGAALGTTMTLLLMAALPRFVTPAVASARMRRGLWPMLLGPGCSTASEHDVPRTR